MRVGGEFFAEQHRCIKRIEIDEFHFGGRWSHRARNLGVEERRHKRKRTVGDRHSIGGAEDLEVEKPVEFGRERYLAASSDAR